MKKELSERGGGEILFGFVLAAAVLAGVLALLQQFQPTTNEPAEYGVAVTVGPIVPTAPVETRYPNMKALVVGSVQKTEDNITISFASANYDGKTVELQITWADGSTQINTRGLNEELGIGNYSKYIVREQNGQMVVELWTINPLP